MDAYEQMEKNNKDKLKELNKLKQWYEKNNKKDDYGYTIVLEQIKQTQKIGKRIKKYKGK